MSTNQHVLIDRGHDYLMRDADSDEEKRFSAVHGNTEFFLCIIFANYDFTMIEGSGMYGNDGKLITRSQKKEDSG